MTSILHSEKSKLIAGLLYITTELQSKGIEPDIHRVFKIMYFADKESLYSYNQPVFGGFCKLQYGPVQDELYQEIKSIRNNQHRNPDFNIYDNHLIEPLSPCDLDEFACSDLECINNSIEENSTLSFEQITKKSHDKAWENTLTGYPMNLIDIAESAGLNKDQIEHIKEIAQNSTLDK